MGSINPTTAIAVLIVLAAVINIICNVIRTIQSTRRKPPLGEDQASLAARLKAVERDVGRKQNSDACKTVHEQWGCDIEEIRARHRTHETKMSNQIAGVHQSIERIGNSMVAKVNKLEGSLETYIKLREGKA